MDTKKLIQKYNIRPNYRLGQNFLIDEKVVTKIIASANIKKNDIVLEVGPGLGALTTKLAQKAKRVIAIEKDEQLAEILKKENIQYKNVEIINGDILEFTPNTNLNNYKIVASLPYYLTARFLRVFLESDNPPEQMTLVVQQEVGERIIACPPEMTLLAISVQYFGQPKIMGHVFDLLFYPKPKVQSVILNVNNIQKRPKNEREAFFNLVKAGFKQPRKQLAGNLQTALKIPRQKTESALVKLGLGANCRGQDTSVENWQKLLLLLK